MSPKDTYLERIVDDDALTAYLTEALGPVTTYDIERHQHGHSNETLFITWGERDLVLRRPPPGETAETAHDVLREYRIMDALQESDVRVPPTVLACEDHDILGCDFYVMEQLEGTVIREAEPQRFGTPEARRRIGDELVDRLVDIHTTDLEAVGLEDLGTPEDYTERQVDRWHRQYEWAMAETGSVRALPAREDVANWLDLTLPDSHPSSLVHGDYKPDNVMFGPDETPEIVGAFDWELATIGDPRFDLGWLLAYWRDPTDPPRAIPELTPDFMSEDAYHTRSELVDRYERHCGIAFENQRFYRTLAVYKLGALCEMFYRRHLEGNADNDLYPKMRERVPALLERARRIIDGEEPL